MRKAYHEKPKPALVRFNNKLGLENPTSVLMMNEQSEGCVDLEAEKKLDTKSVHTHPWVWTTFGNFCLPSMEIHSST